MHACICVVCMYIVHVCVFVLLHMCCMFLVYTHKHQMYLISKHASMFLGLQNLASKIDNDGDVVIAMVVNNESMNYLFWFSTYCDMKELNSKVWEISDAKDMKAFPDSKLVRCRWVLLQQRGCTEPRCAGAVSSLRGQLRQ